MVLIITCFVILVIMMVGVLLEKSWTNPLTLFSALWLTICVLAGLKLFGMYDYSENVFFIILIGMVGTFLGYLFAKKTTIRRPSIPYIEFNTSHSYCFAEKVIYGFLLFSIAIYLVMAVQVLTLLLAGFSTATIREMYRETGTTSVSGVALTRIYGSSVMRTLESYIAGPVVRVCVPLFVVEVIKKGKLSKIAILSLTAVLLNTFCKFGRYSLLYLIASLVLSYIIVGKKMDPKVKKRITRVVVFGLLAVVFLLIYLSMFRWKDEHFSFFESIYGYFSIPVPLLDYWSRHVEDAKAYSLGNSFILGFMGLVSRVLRRLGITLESYEVATLYNYVLADRFIPIFPNQEYNAHVSMFFAFFVDFREIGVFFGCFTWGYMLAKSYKWAKTKRIEYLCIYLLLIQCLIKSFVRWDFVLEQYWICFVIMRLCIRRDIPRKKRIKRVKISLSH